MSISVCVYIYIYIEKGECVSVHTQSRQMSKCQGCINKFPNASCMSYIAVTFFPRVWRREKKAREKMKSRFVIPNRRNVSLSNV